MDRSQQCLTATVMTTSQEQYSPISQHNHPKATIFQPPREAKQRKTRALLPTIEIRSDTNVSLDGMRGGKNEIDAPCLRAR